MKRSQSTILAFIALTVFLTSVCRVSAQGTGFTYQGRLTDNGSPANGIYDLRCALFDAASGSGQVGNPITNAPVTVSSGLFTVTLDFGAGIFTGADRWLEIGVRTNGSASAYATLSPRQPLTPSPYALYSSNAATAVTASNVVASAISAPHLSTPGAPGSGQVLAYNGTSLVWTNAGTVAAAWLLGGNNGTTAGVNFLGTTDNQPLEFKVKGARALRLEPNTNGGPNFIGGASVNFVAPGVVGAVIAGGGATNYFGEALTNSVASSFSTIGGGRENTIEAYDQYCTIGGGDGNTIQADFSYFSTIGGGGGNTVMTGGSTISGGRQNMIDTNAGTATIGGGGGNTIRANASFIGGGEVNTIQAHADDSTIGGGGGNTVMARESTIGGGRQNTIHTNASDSSIGGGTGNTIEANAYDSSVGGGYYNTIQADANDSTIGGGQQNIIQTSAYYSTISGGRDNTIRAYAFWSAISGGTGNTIEANASESAIGGGDDNLIQANADDSTIGGGLVNSIGANAAESTIGGGFANTVQANSFDATIGGGNNNTIGLNANASTIGGGRQNSVQTNASYSTIGGGNLNASGGSYATVPGGFQNDARASYSFAAGRRAKAKHPGAFVWGDSTGTDIDSSLNDQFTVRASGGVRFFSNSGATVGVQLAAGGTGWSAISDRDVKENFSPVDGREVLSRVVAMPIQRWNMKTQDPSIHHVGPMAQDFYAAFSVGEDNKHINSVDADGVALAAIQGLNEIVKEKDAEIQALKKSVADLRDLVTKQAHRVEGGAQ